MKTKITVTCISVLQGGKIPFVLAVVVFGFIAIFGTTKNGYTWMENLIAGPFNDVVDVSAGDMDGDGDRDIIVACNASKKILWYENLPSQTSDWPQHAVTSSVSGMVAVQVADIDADGDMDIFSADASISWYENTEGDGAHWTTHTVSEDTVSADTTLKMVSRDMDKDGDMDLLVAFRTVTVISYASFHEEYKTKIAWYENTAGDGSRWSEHVCKLTSSMLTFVSLHGADVDGDGDVDILTASENTHSTWYENMDGEGTSWVEHELSAATVNADATLGADVDGDGDTDIIALSTWPVESLILWYENTDGGGSAWREHELAFPNGEVRAIHGDDVDGDGDMDLFLIASGDDAIVWYENAAGNGSVWSPHPITQTGREYQALVAEDMDGDGDMDIAFGAGAFDTVGWLDNTAGDGSSFIEHTCRTAYVFQNPVSVAASDVDGDGDLDVFAASSNDDKLACYINTDGNGGPWEEQVISDSAAEASSITAGDVDGDGDIDALATSVTDGRVAWYDNTGGAGTDWEAHVISTAAVEAQSVQAGDMDGDGDVDALVASRLDDKIAWHENLTGDGSQWGEHVISVSAESARSAYPVDMDNDGDMDVLSEAAYGAVSVSWYENLTGDGTSWGHHGISAYNQIAASPRAADLDGDGDMDVVTTDACGETCGAAALAWCENNLTATGPVWTKHLIYAVNNDALGVSDDASLYTTDIDGDGDVDIFATLGSDGKSPVWYENLSGNGFAWAGHTLPVSHAGGQTLFSGDVNADGLEDVLLGFSSPAGLAWYQNAMFSVTTSSGAHGSILPDGVMTVFEGENKHFAISADDGYHVADVLVDGESVGAVGTFSFIQIDHDHTISVSVSPNEVGRYTISATAGNGQISPAGVSTVEEGQDQAYVVSAAPGYHIADVRVDGVSVGIVSSYTFSHVTGNHTIGASFSEDVAEEVTISASAGAGGRISPSGTTIVPAGGTQSYGITVQDGYHVSALVVDGVSLGPLASYTFDHITTSHTIAAVFAPDIEIFSIISSATEGGNLYPSDLVIVNQGDSQHFFAVPAEGYHVYDLLINGASKGPIGDITISDINQDGTIRAVFHLSESRKTINAASGTGEITIDFSGSDNTYIEDVTALLDTDPAVNQRNKPTDYEFPDGLTAFKINRINASEYTVQTSISYPGDYSGDSKFFIVTDNGFVAFGDVEISGQQVVLSLTETGEGDLDGYLTDKIVFLGGPATKIETEPDDGSSSSSGGGGCFISSSRAKF